MAYYKNSSYVKQNDNAGFDVTHAPGGAATFAGIYRCEGCGHEIGIAKTHTLPPQNHHTHTAQQGKILWRLIVATTN